jgi:hypothetical protein
MIQKSKKFKTWEHSQRKYLLDELLDDMDEKNKIQQYSDRDGDLN